MSCDKPAVRLVTLGLLVYVLTHDYYLIRF